LAHPSRRGGAGQATASLVLRGTLPSACAAVPRGTSPAARPGCGCPPAPATGKIAPAGRDPPPPRREEGGPLTGERRARLGRGLEALRSGEASAEGATRAEVPVDAIEENPHQPRKTFDDDEIASLGASIRTHGVLQPLVVRQVGGRYQLIAGERR